MCSVIVVRVGYRQQSRNSQEAASKRVPSADENTVLEAIASPIIRYVVIEAREVGWESGYGESLWHVVQQELEHIASTVLTINCASD